MSLNDDFLGTAHQTLARAKHMLNEQGLQCVDLAPKVFGVGVAVGFDESRFAVLSVLGPPNDAQLMITSAVLRDVPRDRLKVLDACNRHTQNLPAFAVYLHDADAGWDVLMQQSFPIQLFSDVPPFFASIVEGVPSVAAEARASMLEAGVGGAPYAWTADDLDRLLIRSLL